MLVTHGSERVNIIFKYCFVIGLVVSYRSRVFEKASVSEQTIANSIPNLIQCELCKSLSKTIITLYPQGDNG